MSSDEYLTYAQNNCAEWKERGMEILEEMKDEVANLVVPVLEAKTEAETDSDDLK